VAMASFSSNKNILTGGEHEKTVRPI